VTLKKTIVPMGVERGGKSKEKRKNMKKRKTKWMENIRTEIKIKMKCEKSVHTKSQGVNPRTS